MVASAGTVKCELIIKDGNHVLFSDTFFIYVEPNVQDGSLIESTNECDSIIQSLDKVKGYEQEALNVKDHIVSVSNDVDNLKKDIEETYDELENAVVQTKDLIHENEAIKQNETERINAENLRESNETTRATEFGKIKNNAETEITKLNVLKSSFLSQKYAVQDKAYTTLPREKEAKEYYIGNVPPSEVHFFACRG